MTVIEEHATAGFESTLDATLKARWTDALRSGRYHQGSHALRRTCGATSDVLIGSYPDSFCCLGVLCDLVDSSHWQSPMRDLGIVCYGSDHEMPPREVLEAVGLTTTDAYRLAEMNDSGRDFAEIAKAIDWL